MVDSAGQPLSNPLPAVPPQGVSGPPSIGSIVQPIYTIRNIKYFNINESEIESLSSLGVQGNFALTFAVGFISLALSIYVNGAFYDQPIVAAQIAERFIAPLLLVFGIVCFFWLKVVSKKQAKIWGRIKSESRDL